MPDFLDFASPQAEVDAVALLEYHCGISVDMMYGPQASGAYSYMVPDALKSYFRYDEDLEIYSMDNVNVWEDQLRENLDGKMPLYYSSNGPDGGHAYVCDGYDENNMFHFNWGWQGFDNGYFAISSLYLTYYSFPWGHEAIFDFRPNADYYESPCAVENLQAVQENALSVSLSFNPVYTTIGGQTINAIDTIVILRDGQVVEKLTNVTDPQVTVQDQVEKNAAYYYTVYAKLADKISKVARDTVMVGSTCDVQFALQDTGGDGWDMSFIAVLDEDGKISQRVGLMDGGGATLIVPVPSAQKATFFWTYDNNCYSHGTISQCSYQISDWDGNLICASSGTPAVGEITDYQIDCGLNCVPAFDLNGSYLWESSESMGAKLAWSWNGNVDDFASFNIYRAETNSNFELIATIPELNYNYFDALPEAGNFQYKVTVSYERDGETCESEAAASEANPELNYVLVDVTSIAEQDLAIRIYPNPAEDKIFVDGDLKTVTVFDVLGQQLYSGCASEMDIRSWNKGIYFVRAYRADGTFVESKIVKK
jgi:Peptidase C10 family.